MCGRPSSPFVQKTIVLSFSLLNVSCRFAFLVGSETKVAGAYCGTAQACPHWPYAAGRQVLSCCWPGFPTEKISALLIVLHRLRGNDYVAASLQTHDFTPTPQMSRRSTKLLCEHVSWWICLPCYFFEVKIIALRGKGGRTRACFRSISSVNACNINPTRMWEQVSQTLHDFQLSSASDLCQNPYSCLASSLLLVRCRWYHRWLTIFPKIFAGNIIRVKITCKDYIATCLPWALPHGWLLPLTPEL